MHGTGAPGAGRKRPTLADVASHAGTSKTVVSYVLNNGPRPVSESLRAKVIDAIDALGYRPDRRAQSLRRPRRWRQIGLLVPDLALPLFGKFAARIEAEARARDHLTLIGSTGYDPERELEFATAFAEAGIDGLVVIGAANAPETARLCEQERIPVVWMHSVRGEFATPIVGADHVQAGELAVRHLAGEHGCRDIAFVGGFTETDVPQRDREAVRQRFAGANSVPGTDVVQIRTDLTPSSAYAAVSAFLRKPGKAPHAIVAGTWAQTSATIRAITDAGLHIPDDIRVVGFDTSDDDYGQFDVTAVQQPVGAIARQALSRLLDDPAASENRTCDPIDSSLRVGNTCGCGATLAKRTPRT